MKRLLLVLGTVLFAAVVFAFTFAKGNSFIPKDVLQFVSIPTPTPHPLPKTLSIPKLNIYSGVEYVGVTPEGRMDVPKDAWNVGWYQPGPKPGQNGSAVLAGHLDTATGSAVFARLAELIPGDEFSVSDETGRVHQFIVVRKEKFLDAGFPIEEVFGNADEPKVNLITCEGTWNPQTKLYSDRLVVFGELKK